MRGRGLLLRVAALAALAAPGPGAAHEVLHEVRPGGALALRATYGDGAPLAYSQYEVWSPADPRIPWQKGRTDREGWLSFVAAPPGAWRVRVTGADGHGLDTVVEVAAAGSVPARPPAPAPGGVPGVVLRPLLGVVLIGALFGGLVLLYRRRGRR